VHAASGVYQSFLFVVLVAEFLSGKPIVPIVPIVQPDESLATRPPAVTKLTMEHSPPAQAELEPYMLPITPTSKTIF